MPRKEVFSDYGHLLGLQIDRLRNEYYQFKKFSPHCSVCKDEASCQEKVAFGSNETASSPRAAVSPRSELRASPLESGHAPRHFDGTTQGPTAKKALSLEQSSSVSNPCQDPNAFHSLAYESKGLPFETCKDPNEGQSSFMKQNETDMATGFFIDTGLNSDSQKYRIRKESGYGVGSSNDVSIVAANSQLPRNLGNSQLPKTPDRKSSRSPSPRENRTQKSPDRSLNSEASPRRNLTPPRSPGLKASPAHTPLRLSDLAPAPRSKPRTSDMAPSPRTSLGSSGDSALSRMGTFTTLRNDRQTEWNRDIKWLYEDVQDYTLSSVSIAERQQILDSLRARFSRLNKDLNILTNYSKVIGAMRYRHEHSDEELAANTSPNIAYSTKYKSVKFAEPMDDALITVEKVKDKIESLRQKLECDVPSFSDINHQNYTAEIDTNVSDGHCLKGDNTDKGFNKLAQDVDSMVKDIQRLKENQEYKFPEDKGNMATNISPKQDILQYNIASSGKKDNTLLTTALHRLAKLDAGEYAKEIQHHNKDTTGDISDDEIEFSEFVKKETQKKSRDLQGDNLRVNNAKIIPFPTLARAGHFFSVLLIALLFTVVMITSLTPRVCDRSFAHQAAPHLHFIELSWSDGIPPI